MAGTEKDFRIKSSFSSGNPFFQKVSEKITGDNWVSLKMLGKNLLTFQISLTN